MEDIITQGPCYLDSFNPRKMNFLIWENTFEYVIDFLEIPDDRKIEFLFFMLDSTTISILEKIYFYTDIYDNTYEVLISNLEDTFGQYNGTQAAEYRFWSRVQMIGESVPQYVLALRKIISKCSSKCNTINNLKTQFILGLRNNKARSILKTKKNIKLTDAVAIARKLELEEIFSLSS
ncbi:hypothetical protein M0804_014204 [Polistes exclamans]|nr:hypothetical protein M0804_014204 [Polistes exclamans]